MECKGGKHGVEVAVIQRDEDTNEKKGKKKRKSKRERRREIEHNASYECLSQPVLCLRRKEEKGRIKKESSKEESRKEEEKRREKERVECCADGINAEIIEEIVILNHILLLFFAP